nr:uncharacterized protein LOC129452880 isoform X4 [Misgurnus anguillicaudatus]XP_055072927.1 uncharacterized protein LOC129452880 isoform X4 [Misgurnus anguillicaudatus]XP_055072928.1 uncharacterized protein LOC129452880 isoform X4 [Misgurnus anguillicaudatus]XP_055072929.1 uncharacterized protein LOC129452880 isoform X4 [Misgurnus anguillicaudatus]
MKTVDLICVLSMVVNGVFGDTVSVMEGDSVTLHTGLNAIQLDVVIEWMFGNDQVLIAVINIAANTISLDGADVRFRDRLKLNNQTGDLTITDIRYEHTGVYKLEITGEKTTTKTFIVSVFGGTGGVKQISVIEGDSVTLHTGLIEIQRDEKILWLYERENTVLAQINRAAHIFFINDIAKKRIVPKLHLDHQKGGLTIRNIGAAQSGLYQVYIISNMHTIHKRFNITVCDGVKMISIMKGDSVTLHTDLTDVQRDHVMWWISDTVIAEIDGNAQIISTYDGADGRFGDRLKLNNQTGDLTITDIRSTEVGLYNLEISGIRHTLHKMFFLTVCDVVKTVEVTVGNVITLNAGVRSKTYNQLLWQYKDTFIAQLNKTGKIKLTHDGRFRDRLEINIQTGDLTITNIRPEHTGLYKVKISSSRLTLLKKFDVIVNAQDSFSLPLTVIICTVFVPLLLVILIVIMVCCQMTLLKIKKEKTTI